MSAIVELGVRASSFELGRILDAPQRGKVELEKLVPLGGDAVPFLLVYDTNWESFAESVEAHPSVNDVSVVDAFDDVVLFALDWTVHEDDLLSQIAANDGAVLEAWGTSSKWQLCLRFETHTGLSTFRGACEADGIELDVERVTNQPTSTTTDDLGLTTIQRETLLVAVEEGYYDIPRRCTTVELAEKLGVSDQAVTERLRRAIVSLVSNTLTAT
jgi:predicted DNA binding protein